jgi:hypothetical protein
MPLLMAIGDQKGLEGFAAGRCFDLFQWHDIGDMEMRQRRKVRIVWHLQHASHLAIWKRVWI